MKQEQYFKELQFVANQNNGVLRAEDVVAFAQNPDTALHHCFEWDDTVAAHKWRLHQARQLIRAMVTILPSDNDTKYRAFVSMKDDRYNGNGGGYRQITTVLSQDDMWDRYKDEVRQDMLIFIRRWEMLNEVEPVIQEMKKLLDQSDEGTHQPMSNGIGGNKLNETIISASMVS